MKFIIVFISEGIFSAPVPEVLGKKKNCATMLPNKVSIAKLRTPINTTLAQFFLFKSPMEEIKDNKVIANVKNTHNLKWLKMKFAIGGIWEVVSGLFIAVCISGIENMV